MSVVEKGKFIVFEGVDGSGKTTQVERAVEYLKGRGLPCIATREPQNDRPIGKLLRDVLKGKTPLDEAAIALLFAADRLDHLNEINKLLCKGVNVVCDRYYFSSFAYNNASVDGEWVIAINSEAMRVLHPDLVLFLDVPGEISLRRVSERGEKEIFENLERLKTVRENYMSAFERFADSENIRMIDADADVDEVERRVRAALDMLFV